MSLTPGGRLGPYEIEHPLGAGGMGEVFAARDTRLGRAVAVKVLRPEFAQEPARRARFDREGSAIARLAHPHICTLHDIGEADGMLYLVMERLEGETLAARLGRGPLRLDEALTCALQIAEGLAAAHRTGIVHRDLKPANVMLTAEGAKLLDFGLARESTSGGSDAETTGGLTRQGEVLGTLPYMAPEQLEGRAVDARADVFAFGAMLHEMLTGRRVFSGTSQAALAGAILRDEAPPLAGLIPGVPAALDRLVAACLAKDPATRWSSGNDIRLQLRALSPHADAVTTTAPGTRRWLPWSVAALATAVTAAAAWWMTTAPEVPAPRVTRLAIVPPADTVFARGEVPRLSPDGRHVAFSATGRDGAVHLYVQSLESGQARVLEGGDDAVQPFWSPDGRTVAFFADRELRTVPLAGGAPTTLASVALPRGGAWSVGNLILFPARPNTALVYVPAAGGEPKSVPTPDKPGIAGFPSFLPDGRRYVFTELNAETRLPEAVMLGSLDSPEVRRLTASTSNGVVAAGHLLYRRGSTLVAQPFDVDAGELHGEPTAIAENVGLNPTAYQALFSVSETGDLLFRDAAAGAELVWFDRAGARIASAAPAAELNTICLTADERSVVYDQADPATGNIDLWRLDLQTGASTQLTFAGPVEFYPVCAPDSRQIAYAALRPFNPNLFGMSLTAPGVFTTLLNDVRAKIPSDWSRDQKTLIYGALELETGWDVVALDVASGRSRPLVATRADERSGRLSPDGRWLAYVSNESGRFEVYARAATGSGAKWLVSQGGGQQPRWSADGRRLYYMSRDRRLLAVEVRVEGTAFVPGLPVTLMETRSTEWEALTPGLSYAVTADGRRVLVSTSTDTGRPATLVQQWPALVK